MYRRDKFLEPIRSQGNAQIASAFFTCHCHISMISSTQKELRQSEWEEDEDCPSNCKRAKMEECQQEQWSPTRSNEPTLLVFPLDQPSPLGLTLRKSHSLINLIQTKLSEGDTESSETANNKTGEGNEVASQAISDKTKASNFPALALKIGTWECISRYEGDLIVKCLFAKHKFVWEVLEGGLKFKIEIHWSEITAMNASCPDSGPSTLEIEVSRPPLFFRETSPQPRKHTVWQATSDFTAGQATISKVHCLQFAQGVFNRHYHKIMQCDPRLNLLSTEKEISKDPFNSHIIAVQDQYRDASYRMVQDHKSYLLPEVGYDGNDCLPHFPCFSDTEPIMDPTPAPKLEKNQLEYRMVESTSHHQPFRSISDPSPIAVPILVPKLEETESENEIQMMDSLLEKEELHASQYQGNFEDLVTYSQLRKCVQENESNYLTDEDYDISALISRFGDQGVKHHGQKWNTDADDNYR
ncbi:hypothetical protein SUGI_0339350 [Cryptomeria japonica]|nr:hypothetical protein SUGI_0339350 [Cryptomeria japonica]